MQIRRVAINKLKKQWSGGDGGEKPLAKGRQGVAKKNNVPSRHCNRLKEGPAYKICRKQVPIGLNQTGVLWERLTKKCVTKTTRFST